MAKISVLRYGHRIVRDERVTSHCGLVARAFGAEEIIVEGFEDEAMKQTITKMNSSWGSNFKIKFTESWKKTVREYKKKGYFVLHCTMYGMPIQKEIKKIRRKEKILIIIGSQKVEKEVYYASDANISVTTQPHSEVAALAITLHMLFNGKELDIKFEKAKIRIEPQAKGKKVIELKKKK